MSAQEHEAAARAWLTRDDRAYRAERNDARAFEMEVASLAAFRAEAVATARAPLEERERTVIEMACAYVDRYKDMVHRTGSHVWKVVMDTPEMAQAEAHLHAAVHDLRAVNPWAPAAGGPAAGESAPREEAKPPNG